MKTPHEARGKALRQDVTRKSQATFKLARNQPTVFKMIAYSNEDRLPELIALRHFRMSASPFTFYRGTASIMARDLSVLPHTGIPVQAVGDAHLMNFGGFATPERNTSQQIFYKITQNVLGLFEIADQPPLVYHPIDVKKHIGGILKFLDEYESTLQDDRTLLFKQFKVVDVALKVVGVGSVGTRCYVVLLMNESRSPCLSR